MSDQASKKDLIYAEVRERVDGFVFDQSVAEVFDDMIRRSVPGYAMTLSLMPLIAQRFAQAHSRIYDLGCSLGAGLVSTAKEMPPDTELIGVDNSEAMLERCRLNLQKSIPHDKKWSLRCEDLLETPIENASIVLLNFTLQFIPLEKRAALLRSIVSGLNPGGVLLLSEKVRFDDPVVHEHLFELHHAFKRANHYSDLEISQKRASLENVLIPESTEEHRARLLQSGFEHADVWLQCFNFVSLLAIKKK